MAERKVAAQSWALLAHAQPEMARRRCERATRPQECVKSHRAYAQFVATQGHWDGQKQEPACKEMLGRKSCMQICLLFLSPSFFEFKLKVLGFC